MNIFNSWQYWTILYLISSIIFARAFKKANRNMKNAGSLTILIEFFTAIFAIFLIPFFEFKFTTDLNIYLILFVVTILYAVTDRLNIEARYGLDPSIFSMLKQSSTVYLIIFGFIFLKEKFLINKLIGSIVIILANLILFFEKGKFKINRYYVLTFISNLLFAVAMLINVNISENFNLAIYTIFTVLIPAFYIFIFGKHTIKGLATEFNLYDKKCFIISGFTWCLMLISSVKAYQVGNVTVVASLLSLTGIINALIEYFFYHDKSKFKQKIIAAILTIIGVILLKS